jgi:alkyl hydroperoxide reductase subunit AhpC
MLKIGHKAPEFTMDGVKGNGDFSKFSLSDFKGKWTVLFFYPLDFTFVCPTEILEFSKAHGEFAAANAVVLGCSIDSKFSHQQWIKKGGLGELTFPLLSDIKHDVARAYGAYIDEAGIATRATFIIDPEGTLKYACYHNTDVGRSVDETLRVLQALQTGERCPANWKKGQQTLGK